MSCFFVLNSATRNADKLTNLSAVPILCMSFVLFALALSRTRTCPPWKMMTLLSALMPGRGIELLTVDRQHQFEVSGQFRILFSEPISHCPSCPSQRCIHCGAYLDLFKVLMCCVRCIRKHNSYFLVHQRERE